MLRMPGSRAIATTAQAEMAEVVEVVEVVVLVEAEIQS